MKTNKKSKNLIGIIQSFLILILVVLIIFMMIQISRLQGTARVINYAGLVRGATQREIKLEITGNQNDGLIKYLDDILFLQQHAIHDKKTLDALVDGSSAKYHELMKTIKDAEEKMATNKVIKTHIINYAKTRETYITYRKSGYSKKFFEAHRDEITLHKAAKEAFSKLPDGKIPKVKDLNEEFVRLLSEKKADYSEYKKIKKEIIWNF